MGNRQTAASPPGGPQIEGIPNTTMQTVKSRAAAQVAEMKKQAAVRKAVEEAENKRRIKETKGAVIIASLQFQHAIALALERESDAHLAAFRDALGTNAKDCYIVAQIDLDAPIPNLQWYWDSHDWQHLLCNPLYRIVEKILGIPVRFFDRMTSYNGGTRIALEIYLKLENQVTICC